MAILPTAPADNSGGKDYCPNPLSSSATGKRKVIFEAYNAQYS